MSDTDKLRKLGDLSPEAAKWLFTRQEGPNAYLNRVCWLDRLRQDRIGGTPNPDELVLDETVFEQSAAKSGADAESNQSGQNSEIPKEPTSGERPDFVLELRSEVANWVGVQSNGSSYLESVCIQDKTQQTQRPPLPEGSAAHIMLQFDEDGEPDFTDAQKQFFTYVMQIFSAAPDRPRAIRAGTGCLVEYQGRGYLATCAHILRQGNLRFVIPYENKQLTHELASCDIFGTPFLDCDKDLAYLPILQPQILLNAGLRFCPLEPPTESEIRLYAATGYPAALTKKWTMQRDHAPGEDLVDSINVAITAFQNPEHPVTEKLQPREHPHSTLGFRLMETWFEDAVGEEFFPLPGSVQGMSGGPIWGIRRDGTIQFSGVLTLETNDPHLPRELWGVPRDAFVIFLETAERSLEAD